MQFRGDFFFHLGFKNIVHTISMNKHNAVDRLLFIIELWRRNDTIFNGIAFFVVYLGQK